MLNKQTLVEHVLTALEREVENYARSAQAAHAEATAPENKAENKYDTRGLEASYLAAGQSRQAAEARQAVEEFRALAWGPCTKAQLGALVETERGGERLLYLMGPRAGGTEVAVEGTTVVVITRASPLGQALEGKAAGARWTMRGEAVRVVGVW